MTRYHRFKFPEMILLSVILILLIDIRLFLMSRSSRDNFKSFTDVVYFFVIQSVQISR